MRVEATVAAAEVVARIAASGRHDLVMVLSNGCCDATAPYLYDAYVPPPDATEVGAVAGIGILAPAWIRALYPDEVLVLDVIDGALDDALSLETDLDRRFVLRAPGNAGLG